MRWPQYRSRPRLGDLRAMLRGRSAQRFLGSPHMPKKNSINGSANEFKAETAKIKSPLKKAAG